MNGRVLVVDDSRVVRAFARRILVSGGFEVVEAENGRHGLEQAREGVECVLCDVVMPEVNGLEFLELLSEWDGERPSVVMTSSDSEPELVRQALALGAVGWMLKPLHPKTLLVTVRKLVGPAATRFLYASGDGCQEQVSLAKGRPEFDGLRPRD